MPVVAVINRKGGSGKSTLATHLAAYCSAQGWPVLLGDTDRNQSSMAWLRMREHNLPNPRAPIVGRWVDPRSLLRPPPGTQHVVLDTPGGLHGFELARLVCHADAVLLPLCNSLFDRESAAECWAELKTQPRVTSGRCKVAALGMRLDARTKGSDVLAQWAQGLGLPFLGSLRETQGYVRCVENGLTLFDLVPSSVAADMAQWAPVLKWLQPVLSPELSAQEQIQRRIYKPNQKPGAAGLGKDQETSIGMGMGIGIGTDQEKGLESALDEGTKAPPARTSSMPPAFKPKPPVLGAAGARNATPAERQRTGKAASSTLLPAAPPAPPQAPPSLVVAGTGEWGHRLGKMLGGLQLRRFLMQKP